MRETLVKEIESGDLLLFEIEREKNMAKREQNNKKRKA
jgi:hypothetical protein